MMEALQKETYSETQSGRSGISLADLKARRTPVEWFEAIAVIQELCRALIEAGVIAEQASFGPGDVTIDSAGRVTVSLDREGSESVVRQVGELLHVALSEAPFPVSLRLVIMQSTSTPPFYASIAELSSALEYFERPDRPGLVRVLYERARMLPVVAPASEKTAQPEQTKAEQQKQKKKAAKGPRRPLPKSLIYGAAAAVAAIAVTAGALAWSAARPQQPAPVAELEKEPTKTSAHARSRSNSTSIDSRAAVESPRSGSLKGTGGTTGSSLRSPGHGLDVNVDAAVMLAPVDELPSEAASAGSARVTLETYSFPGEAEPVGTTIYSATDRDVTPPLATYPRLPAAPPDGVPAETVSTLELLVNETGEVESVRMRGEPAHIADALFATMNLSAAKTWRFAPAVKDGRPVRYRKLVQVWRTAP